MMNMLTVKKVLKQKRLVLSSVPMVVMTVEDVDKAALQVAVVVLVARVVHQNVV
jgi:hypothetical protein